MLSMLSMDGLGLKCGPENWIFLLTKKCQSPIYASNPLAKRMLGPPRGPAPLSTHTQAPSSATSTTTAPPESTTKSLCG
jgi:hypothetical protein